MEAVQTPTAIEFGRFRVLPHRRELLAEGRPLELGGRAFDVLMVLIEASGAVVGKDALMHRVWPGRVVEENNLQAQIAALRRALAADRDLIRTVAGRGYQFTGEIRTGSATPNGPISAQPTLMPSRPPTNLPQPVSELIGRDAELDEILDLGASHRLLTLTGAGGIGKTRLGFEAARHLLPRFADGVWAIELAPLSDPELVPVAVATTLGLEPASGTATPLSVANALRSKQLMLVLDNCEHVIDAAARMAEALLRGNPAIRVIATSREPLRAEGEWVYRVPPLAAPADGSPDGEDPLQYGAVRLFVERARAAAPSFSPDVPVAAAIAGICRRLDGIPLAIELAAARAATLGIEGIAAGLDDRFRLLAGGYRTATPRHQTLRATLDWSYELLPETEQVILRRLSVFAGDFVLDAAIAVNGDVAASQVADDIANLVAKSLVVIHLRAETAHYRLLNTTRLYASDRLRESGEHRSAARRHAKYYLTLYANAEVESETRTEADWLAIYGRHLDNVRVALDWAFSPDGDIKIAVALTVGVVPLWFRLSLMNECHERVKQAIRVYRDISDGSPRFEMQLNAALATSLYYTQGAVAEIDTAWAEALEIAERLDETDYQLRALWGLWSYRIAAGDYPTANSLAQRFRSLAAQRTDQGDQLIGERMIGGTLHFLGDQLAARRHLELMLSGYDASVHRPHIVRFHYDQQLAARVTLARVLWLQGFTERASRIAAAAVDEARATEQPISLCFALAEAACPIAVFTGNFATADYYVETLLTKSAEYALSVFHARGLGAKGMLSSKSGDPATGLRSIRAVLSDLNKIGYHAYPMLLGSLAEALGAVGEVDDGLAVIETALSRCERNGERWYIADLLRVRGKLLLRQATVESIIAAEDYFRKAIDLAREQGALFWELRAALSLADLRLTHGRRAHAKEILAPVCDRFTEGFGTVDLQAAKTLLDQLA